MTLMLALIVMACGCNHAIAQKSVSPLLQAHAHNDYLHKRPLLDALDHGFCSVEADIYLVDGELLVAHTFLELKPENTLQKLYLDPLKARVKQNGGLVYPDGPEFTLLIDIKNNGAKTFEVLQKKLTQYPDVFSVVDGGKLTKKAVRVIVSGDRAFDLIAKTSPRHAAIDGRLTDLDSPHSVDLMPLISDNWRQHFQWRGKGQIPPDELQRLKDVVAKAHAAGRRIRFWGIPDTPAVWKMMNDAEVDLINTDDLSGLRNILIDATPIPTVCNS